MADTSGEMRAEVFGRAPTGPAVFAARKPHLPPRPEVRASAEAPPYLGYNTPRDLGACIHAFLGQLCTGPEEISLEQMLRLAHDHARRANLVMRNAATMQYLAGAAAAYLAWLRPPSSMWEFVGDEQQLGRRRLDLLFRRRSDELLIADELKLVLPKEELMGTDTRDQVLIYLQEACARWGRNFGGLRLLSLTAPGRSLFIEPDGNYEHLYLTEMWFPRAVVPPSAGREVSPE